MGNDNSNNNNGGGGPHFKTISGVVERITFQSGETGYTVARLLPDSSAERKSGSGNNSGASPRRFATRGEDNLVTIVGTLTSVAAGEALELSGQWQQHAQHGWQFKVENYRSILPATEQGIRKYLGSGLIKGIGPKTAEKIVAFFGVETLDVLEVNPDRLLEVPKLGQHKSKIIAAAWVEQKAIKEVMVFLQGQGISTSLAVRIYKQYKDASITIVNNEPYRLAREVWGIGFKTADKIAQALGFTQDDPERLKAGTLFVLSEASDSGGHTYLPRPLLAEKASELLGVAEALVEEAITGLSLDGGAQVETLLADPSDGSLSFQPLVAVTLFSGQTSAQPTLVAPPPVSMSTSALTPPAPSTSTSTSSGGVRDAGNPSSRGQKADTAGQTRTSSTTRGSEGAGEEAQDNSGSGLEADLDEALGYSLIRYARTSSTTASALSHSKAVAAHSEPVTATSVRSDQSVRPAMSVTTSPSTSAKRVQGSLGVADDKVEKVGVEIPLSAREIFVGATPTLSALPGEQAVYLPPFYWAEVGVARNLLRLANCTPQQDQLSDMAHTDFKTMFDYLATKDPARLSLADRQQEGVVMAIARPVGVLTGGPGTGKTTSMKALMRALTLKKKRIVLAAPTGRAAKRLSEATGLEAKTLHRLLGLKPGGKSQYDYKEGNPIPADIVIVDETSMLDTLLVYSLLKGIATGTHLLLVGDADQLPSVGAGNILSDIINSGIVPVVRLDHIFRQGAGSAIVTNAHRINKGQMPLTGPQIKDFFFFPQDDPELAGDLVVDLVAHRIPSKFGFKPQDVQVLAPMHRGRSGVGYLNEKLQEVLNPPAESKPQKLYGSKMFRVGDKVMQLRNNYDKQVYNGDGGSIVDISLENQIVKVKLEDEREVEYEFGELDELTLAYAVSIHKSQGSEYPVVVVPVAMGHFMLLERKLIYTAVTRAKKLVVMVGSKKALAIAVRNGPKVGHEHEHEHKGEPDHEQSGNVAATDDSSSGKAKSSQHRAGRYTGLATRLVQVRQEGR